MRYCKDCRYFKAFTRCHHPSNKEILRNVVDGEFDYFMSAVQMRRRGNPCGPTATLFRPSFWYTIRSTILNLLGRD